MFDKYKDLIELILQNNNDSIIYCIKETRQILSNYFIQKFDLIYERSDYIQLSNLKKIYFFDNISIHKLRGLKNCDFFIEYSLFKIMNMQIFERIYIISNTSESSKVILFSHSFNENIDSYLEVIVKRDYYNHKNLFKGF